MRKKRQLIVASSMRPTAFVMPEKREPTDAEFEAMTDEEWEEYWRHHARVDEDGYNIEYSPGFLFEGDEAVDWEEEFAATASEIDKAVAPLIYDAETADMLATVPHEPPIESVEIEDGAGDALKQLILAVTLAVNRWPKPPKPTVIAAAIGLAVAHSRQTKGVKHPRDIAKEVGVRPQTLFKVRKIALEEIARLGLAESFSQAKEIAD